MGTEGATRRINSICEVKISGAAFAGMEFYLQTCRSDAWGAIKPRCTYESIVQWKTFRWRSWARENSNNTDWSEYNTFELAWTKENVTT
jgi:hypothetical protein